jgi:hypothetical protein
MTRTVRIDRDRLWASLMEASPDARGNGTDLLANAVLRLADQP